TGDVRVARLVIQDGATFSGNVSMGPQPDAFVAPRETPAAAAAPEAAPATPTPSTDGKAKGKPKR
ncbi:MAG TPA: polymer-forming cytoskeletal protein, partial [Candidatus Dormibacteraeota bacterium]